MDCEAVILAAGLGTRMVSATPKALHRLGGQPLLTWVERACREAVGRPPVVVVGPEAGAEAAQVVPPDVRFVVQETRRGTGHALQQAAAVLRGHADLVLVATADMPLIRGESLRRLVERQTTHAGPVTMMTIRAVEARGFGRVERGPDGEVRAVVEEAMADAAQLAIGEFNASLYCFRARWLWDELPRLRESPQGEMYLTDLVARAAAAGGVAVEPVADPDEVIGINTREHLALAERALRRRVNRGWMLAGVSLVDPETTYIESSVQLAPDVEVLPNTHLRGATVVGRGSRLGPNTVVTDSIIGEACRVEASVIEGARLEDEVRIGPFAHLRSGARLGRGVHMGNFGEVKNSVLGAGVKMGHFSYVGDAEIGAETNIGAGTITCNFSRDGKKNRTRVGKGVFLGSDSLLVAPVEIGDAAATGAGSVVTRDVPAGRLAVGMPARVVRHLEE
ncbi:MAG TPA: bifunctional UDP-N-acetylglucosamine diphosphorylase/glucosamine-1-phosphate N-acetyltransferase GlmU [Anaerolineales bacterium]|nr:bifunctional UDP-N-acetylglucosamine diphosphorylase/glucosamine-1-phosphate N-acetyltransferase GlmU [Anaerolineales bacterium]